MIQAILFDLDGTLADTAADLGGALNRQLRRHGKNEVPLEQVRSVATHGSAAFIRLGFGIDGDSPDFETLRQEYLDEYRQNFCRDTVLFAGINPLLLELAERGIKWGIVTNKHRQFTDNLVPALDFAVPPQAVVSGDTCTEAKPSAMPLLYACKLMNVEPENCLYVGDAERDMQAAKNAGMRAVLAEWGYIAESDCVAEWGCDAAVATPDQLLDCLV
ncbi:HAD-IA family hydrolase [Neisseria sp. ZJ106]|uniref:phosphoglycolate phosphatase n=1 Tax=Neisseria lisongii TaxID=2912188 RepID=A0AAW5AGC8_9NEIS|nr:HAD-IA family hydrolase [Neisseria lisongii]MCF7521402.1 HAD-IA family hydrolase [Neisseria lisongii]MCF7530369.1 HAD-IA family hydrolase [Neisseria lisongii]WCL71926.1 HAD-IA family hydrolase [Neisseria lisongii]